MLIMEEPQVTINLGSFFHWFIGGTLTINLGLLIRIIWWISKYYKKYKNAFMMFIEEHEELVADYNRRHPGQEIYFAGKRSRLHSISKSKFKFPERNQRDSSNNEESDN